MLISMLPLVGNLYWKRVFNKQTMTTICYWYIWQEASHWMLISMLPLVGSLYWKRVFNKQTMTVICYWYAKWLNFDMHQMVWILVISIAKEYILFALHLCPLCNYYITGCRKLLTILIIWQEASHWMLISMLPLVGNLYWKRVFNKQTMTAICYWYIWQEASHWMLISMLPLVWQVA
jgi:hypothetical protein